MKATQFYSECGEDRWLYERGLLAEKGLYVDLGAAWPRQYSNTALLRDMGWTGLQVDACPEYRPLWEELGLELTVAVLWTEPEARYLYNPDRPNLSKISAAGSPVPARLLSELLESKGIELIDLLNVDLEGAEFPVLAGLDLDRHRPRIIIWEYNTLGVKNEQLLPYLEARGYRRLHQTECNYIHAAL